MKRYFVMVLTALLAVMICTYQGAQAAYEQESGIEKYMNLYDAHLLKETVNIMHNTYQPQTMDCGLIYVTFEEIVFDGRWVYTSASVVPAPEAEVLIMPGSAELGDSVAGGNGEKSRTDTRSFRDMATMSQQQLLAVYVYIKEFDEVSPYYILDHFQEKDNSSILLSGAPLLSDMDELALHWTVQIYSVDINVGSYSLVGIYEYPVTVSLLAPKTKKTYTNNAASDIPFSTITLIKTALTTYAIPDWENEEDQGRYGLVLLNESQAPYDRGTPPDINTYNIDQLPETLNVVLIDYTDESILAATYLCGE